jgi:phage tail-like protein
MNRFLAIFEQAFDPAVQTLGTLWAYLDPLTTSEAMLPFLAQWVGWPSDMAWSFSQRRLIRYALSIYRWRGTRWGMLLFLHLYTGLPLCEADIPPEEAHLIDSRNCESADQPESLRHIRVDEDSIEGFVVGNTSIGSEAMLGGGRPYHFTVRLRSPTRLNEAQVRRLINQEKPAFSSYTLHIVYYDRTASDV